MVILIPPRMLLQLQHSILNITANRHNSIISIMGMVKAVAAVAVVVIFHPPHQLSQVLVVLLVAAVHPCVAPHPSVLHHPAVHMVDQDRQIMNRAGMNMNQGIHSSSPAYGQPPSHPYAYPNHLSYETNSSMITLTYAHAHGQPRPHHRSSDSGPVGFSMMQGHPNPNPSRVSGPLVPPLPVPDCRIPPYTIITWITRCC